MLSNLLNMPWEPNKTHMQAELSFWVSILWPEVSEHPLSFKSRGSSGLWKLLKNTPSKFHPFLSSQVLFVSHLSYCGASLVAQMVKNLPAMRETWVQFLDRKDPPEKRMATHSSILAWRIPWIEESGGLQSMGLQSWTQLRDFYFTELLWQLPFNPPYLHTWPYVEIVSADVIELRWGHEGGAQINKISDLIRWKKETQGQTCTVGRWYEVRQGKRHVTMQADDGVMCLQAKGCWQHQTLRKGHGAASPLRP